MMPGLLGVPRQEAISEIQETSTSGLRSRQSVIFGAAICLGLLTGVWLRWTGLAAQSLWADEGYTTWFSKFSPAAQWHLMPWETQAPIYHVALHYWTALWGTSENSFRALSALFSSLSLIVVSLIARKMWRDRLFLLVSVMLSSVSLFQIWYAKESRSYALLSFLLLVSVYCLQLYLDRPNALRLVGVAAALLAGLYTHNMALYYVPGFVVFWFIYPSQMVFRERVKNAIVLALLVTLIYLPWLPILVQQAKSVHGYFWAPKPSLRDLCNTVCIFSGLDSYVLKHVRYYVPVGRLFGYWFWTEAAVAMVVLCVVATRQVQSPTDRRKALAVQVYSLLPLVLVFGWSRISTSVYVNRNLIGAAALLPLVLCAPAAVQVKRKKRLFQCLACIALLGSVISLCLHQESKDDWRGVTEYLLKIPEQHRLVLVFQPYCQILVHYYATGLFKSYPQPEIEGLITNFDSAPSGPGILPSLPTADTSAMLSKAIESHRYKEIDVALQMERLPTNMLSIPGLLRGRCVTVENVEFEKIGILRCIL
jgi:4-amino-4-deoxy-L-arabinose transferase-like glycosyltransferase